MQWLATSCHFYGHFTAADQMAAGSLFKVSMTGGIPGIRHHGFEDVKNLDEKIWGIPIFSKETSSFSSKLWAVSEIGVYPPHKTTCLQGYEKEMDFEITLFSKPCSACNIWNIWI